ncbi:HNH endonuclease signature motif containing protein, partial [Frankia canadensis]|uniref:HNH endonuclease signature motif containing protein n=1 Tax=Frankia canadensis TaxID=1836972 RepID=UPI001055882A
GIPDPRSPRRRQADALIDLATRLLSGAAVPISGGVRPHLTVLVPWSALVGSGLDPATTEWGLPLPRGVLSRLTCDAEITRIILDAEGVPIDVGRASRTATPAIRRALVARDRGCAFPSCDRPPSWCECHHAPEWENDGVTALSSMVLLCGQHHRQVHHDKWTIIFESDGLPS